MTSCAGDTFCECCHCHCHRHDAALPFIAPAMNTHTSLVNRSPHADSTLCKQSEDHVLWDPVLRSRDVWFWQQEQARCEMAMSNFCNFGCGDGVLERVACASKTFVACGVGFPLLFFVCRCVSVVSFRRFLLRMLLSASAAYPVFSLNGHV